MLLNSVRERTAEEKLLGYRIPNQNSRSASSSQQPRRNYEASIAGANAAMSIRSSGVSRTLGSASRAPLHQPVVSQSRAPDLYGVLFHKLTANLQLQSQSRIDIQNMTSKMRRRLDMLRAHTGGPNARVMLPAARGNQSRSVGAEGGGTLPLSHRQVWAGKLWLHRYTLWKTRDRAREQQSQDPRTATVSKFLRQPRLRLHSMVVREMVQLQKGFVVTLNTAVQGYVIPLREATTAGFLAVDSDHFTAVFGRFEPLFDCHKQLLLALVAAVQDDSWPDVDIGDSLETWASSGLELHEEWQSSVSHITLLLAEMKADDPVLRNLLAHGLGKMVERDTQNTAPQGGIWDTEAGWKGLEQLLQLKPLHPVILSCQLGELPSCAGLKSFEDLLEAPGLYLSKMQELVMQWYLTIDETKSATKLQQASDTSCAVSAAAKYVSQSQTRREEEAESCGILQWIDLPPSLPSVGLKFMREGPVDCVWNDGPRLPSYAYLFDVVLIIASHQRTGVKYQHHMMLSGVKVERPDASASSLILHKPAVPSEQEPARRIELYTPTATDAQSWASTLTELSKTIDAQQVIDAWEAIEATLGSGQTAAEESEIIQAEHIKRARLKQLVCDKIDSLQEHFEQIETLSNAAESRFWKSVMWSYFHAVRSGGHFSVVNLEGISHEEKLVEAAMAAVRDRVNQLEDAFAQADHTFVGQLQERLSKHLERHDVTQMQVCAVLESLNAKFEMLGRKVLTCDKLVRDRDARAESALQNLRQEKALLHRKRLDKKRELNMHQEVRDVAQRENSDLRDELVAVQQQIERAHRKLIDEEVKRRKDARRDNAPHHP